MDRQEAERLLNERVDRRRARDFEAADALRARLRDGGWEVVDSATGSELVAIKAAPQTEPVVPRAVSLITVVQGWQADAERWLLSVFTQTKADFEAIVIDNSADPRIAGWLKNRAAERLRAITLDPPLGFAAAVNAGIDAAAGDVVVLFDPGVELKGDVIGRLVAALANPSVAVAGPFGLRARGTMKEFEESPGPEVDAIEGYCMAFRAADARATDGFDPGFRFYRMADVEFSFRLRAQGGRALVVSGLPVERHEHRVWESTDANERARLSKRNTYRFLDRWRDREDLLVGQ